MLSQCHNFKIFGDGGNRLIFIAEDDPVQTAYIVNNPFLYSMTTTCDVIEHEFFGNFEKVYTQGLVSSELNFRAGKIEAISGKDIADIYDPVMQKSVVELMKVVNKKLSQRG